MDQKTGRKKVTVALVERTMVRILRVVTGRPIATLAISLAVTILAVYAGLQLEIRTDMKDLFPEHTPHVVRMKEIEALLGYTSQIKLIIGSPDRDANIRFATALADEVSVHPRVERVECRRDVEFFRRRALLFLPLEELEQVRLDVDRAVRKAVARSLGPFDEEEEDDEGDWADEDDLDEDFGDEQIEMEPPEAAGSTPGFAIPTEEEVKKRYGLSHASEHFISQDGTIIGINVFPVFSPDEVEKSRSLLADINQMVSALDPSSHHPEMRFAIDGGFHRRAAQLVAIKKDLRYSSGIAAIVISLLILLYFGKLRSLLFVLVPLGVGIGWSMGMAWLAVGYLNGITAFIFTILFGLGVDFAIHATSRYFEERGAGLDARDAAVTAVSRLGRPMLSAAITTSLTFLSLSFLDFKGFSQFGLLAGMGVLVCLLALVLVFPALAVAADRLVAEKPGVLAGRLGGIPWFAAGPRPARWTLLALLAVVVALSPGLLSVHLDPDLSKVEIRGDVGEQILRTAYRRKVENLSSIPVILPVGSAQNARLMHEHLDNNPDRFPTLQRVLSIHSFVPDKQQAKLPVIASMRETIRKKRRAMQGDDAEAADRALEYLAPAAFGMHDLPPWVREKFTDKKGEVGGFLFLWADVNVADSMDIKRAVNDFDSVEVQGQTYHACASYFIGFDVFDLVNREGPIAILIAALAVLLVLIADLRRPSLVAIAYLPLPVGLAAFLGLAGLCGWSLNVFNMVILPTFLGIGVDTSIHLVHRAREEVAKAQAEDRPARLGTVVASTGAAAGMSSLTTAAGFACMMVASNQGLASIGMLAPVGIFLCFLAATGVTGSLLHFRVGKAK